MLGETFQNPMSTDSHIPSLDEVLRAEKEPVTVWDIVSGEWQYDWSESYVYCWRQSGGDYNNVNFWQHVLDKAFPLMDADLRNRIEWERDNDASHQRLGHPFEFLTRYMKLHYLRHRHLHNNRYDQQFEWEQNLLLVRIKNSFYQILRDFGFRP